jgi:PAS domain S-box-containing protein
MRNGTQSIMDYVGAVGSNLGCVRSNRVAPSRPGFGTELGENTIVAAIEGGRALFDATPTGIIVFSEDGRLLSANASASRIIGGQIEQLKRQNFYELRSWKDSGMLEMAVAALEGGRIVEGCVHCSTTFHKDIWMSIKMVPVTQGGAQVLLGLFSDITEQKKTADQNATSLVRLEAALKGTVSVIRKLSEARDPYTAGHQRRVGDLARAIGKELGLDETMQEALQICGSLHDTGKINAPAEILAKPGRLNASEFSLIKEHAVVGYEILKDAGLPWPVALVALQHHERMDGSGYPYGISGEQIAPESRIVAVADVVEAMASHRPYRPALGIDEALATIEAGCGTLFDCDVVIACIRLFRERGYRLSDSPTADHLSSADIR